MAQDETYKYYILKRDGAEGWEKVQTKCDMLLTKVLPYLKLHCNLYEMEQTAAQPMEAGETLTPEQTEYFTAVLSYVDECREKLNNGDYARLPAQPQLTDFSRGGDEMEAYKAHVQEEITKEAAAAGMTVEEYAANGYEPRELPQTAPEQPWPPSLDPAVQPVVSVKYYSINEETARLAKHMNSFDDYTMGQATAEYRSAIDKAAELAKQQKKRVDPMYHDKIDSLLNTYSRKLAENMNSRFSIDARVPSILISGGGNFSTRKKEKQNAARDHNMEDWQDIQGLLDKIRSTGMGGISADDPQALQKLQSKLDGLVQSQETMKAVNAYFRKHGTLDGCTHLTPEQIGNLKASMAHEYHLEGKPYPTWALSNNSAEIRRIRERIESLKQHEQRSYASWEFDGGRVEANKQDNRLQVFFDDKPDGKMREELKAGGFRWAPSVGAWQRQLNTNAYRAAAKIESIQPISKQEAAPMRAAEMELPKEKSQPTPTGTHQRQAARPAPKLRFTDEQYKIAREQSSALEYARSKGYDLVKESSRNYHLREHDSMVFTQDGRWYWNSHGLRGGALEFLQHYEGMTLPQAVLTLCGQDIHSPQAAFPAPKPQPVKEEPFQLPPACDEYRRLYGYLLNTRGLDRGIVTQLVKDELIYPNVYKGKKNAPVNAVFVGRDEQGAAQSAFLRGCNSGSTFKMEARGSDKSCPFSMVGAAGAKTLCVFEGAIDAISHATVTQLANLGMWTDVHRIAQGGNAPAAAMVKFLHAHPEVAEVHWCMDNDAAGVKLAQQAADRLTQAGYGHLRFVSETPPCGKDWNEYLMRWRDIVAHYDSYPTTEHDGDKAVSAERTCRLHYLSADGRVERTVAYADPIRFKGACIKSKNAGVAVVAETPAQRGTVARQREKAAAKEKRAPTHSASTPAQPLPRTQDPDAIEAAARAAATRAARVPPVLDEPEL